MSELFLDRSDEGGVGLSDRTYYSARTGKAPERLHLDLEAFRRLFIVTYQNFARKEYFQEAMGKDCVDVGLIPGTMGYDPASYALLKLRKGGLFPIDSKAHYSEEDIFDLIEFLSDHVSKPLKGDYHSWNECGWHYETFDRSAGRQEFREAMSVLLKDYGDGWELSERGEILSVGDKGMNQLYAAQLPQIDAQNVNILVEAAVRKFRSHKSSLLERKEAVRALVDVLEFLRPQAKEVLTKKDESDLFEIANKFGIRHHRQDQQIEYDQAIWLSWMFYHFLATIHAVVRLIQRKPTNSH